MPSWHWYWQWELYYSMSHTNWGMHSLTESSLQYWHVCGSRRSAGGRFQGVISICESPKRGRNQYCDSQFVRSCVRNVERPLEKRRQGFQTGSSRPTRTLSQSPLDSRRENVQKLHAEPEAYWSALISNSYVMSKSKNWAVQAPQ